MSIAKKLSESPPASRRICRTCSWLATQSEEDQAAINKAMEDPAWSVEAILRVLRDDGITVSTSAFRHHIAQGH